MEQQPPIEQEMTKEQLSELLQIRRDKLAALQQAGKDPYQIVTFDQSHHSADILANFDALEGQTVQIAGRMMSKRIMGKASFAHVLDGKIVALRLLVELLEERLLLLWDLAELRGGEPRDLLPLMARPLRERDAHDSERHQRHHACNLPSTHAIVLPCR